MRSTSGSCWSRPGSGSVAELHVQGFTEARLYGANDRDGVGGIGSIFLLLDEPEVYGLPPDPRVPTADLTRQEAVARGTATLRGSAGVSHAVLLDAGPLRWGTRCSGSKTLRATRPSADIARTLTGSPGPAPRAGRRGAASR
jgi:hypothetical protein